MFVVCAFWVCVVLVWRVVAHVCDCLVCVVFVDVWCVLYLCYKCVCVVLRMRNVIVLCLLCLLCVCGLFVVYVL